MNAIFRKHAICISQTFLNNYHCSSAIKSSTNITKTNTVFIKSN